MLKKDQLKVIVNEVLDELEKEGLNNIKETKVNIFSSLLVVFKLNLKQAIKECLIERRKKLKKDVKPWDVVPVVAVVKPNLILKYYEYDKTTENNDK